MDTNANPTTVPTKKPSLGQRIKRFFSGSKSKTTTGEQVVEEKHEVEKKQSKDARVDEKVVTVPPGPVMVPGVMIPVVGAQQQGNVGVMQPPQPLMNPEMYTEKQAFGSIIESRPIGVTHLHPPQSGMSGPAPIPVQQIPPPIQPVFQPIPPPTANQQGLYQPKGEILPEPVTLSVMGPVQKPIAVTEYKVTALETKPLTAAGKPPIETGGMVYNGPVIQPNQGVYVNQGQQQIPPHLQNMVEITGSQPHDPTFPRDLTVGPATKANPVFRENLQNLKNDSEYISRHLAEDNPAKPSPFQQLQQFGKIPNPAYAGGKPFFLDMLYNPDPIVPLGQYPEPHHHVPLQVIGEKNAELVEINKMNEVQMKEHKDTMRSDPYYK